MKNALKAEFLRVIEGSLEDPHGWAELLADAACKIIEPQPQDPTTPQEVLHHLAQYVQDDRFVVCVGDAHEMIREFCRLAGLSRSMQDLRENALDAALMLRKVSEVEL